MNTLTFHPSDVAVDATSSFFAYDPYIETFWLPVLGPTATWLMNELCFQALTSSGSFTIPTHEMSLRVGTGSREGTSSPVVKQLSRLCQAHVVYRYSQSEYLVPRTIEPVKKPLILKLSDEQLARHEKWMDRLQTSPAETQKKRVRALVTRLEMMGSSEATISTALLSTGLHPSIIGQAIAPYTQNSPTSHGNTAA